MASLVLFTMLTALPRGLVKANAGLGVTIKNGFIAVAHCTESGSSSMATVVRSCSGA